MDNLHWRTHYGLDDQMDNEYKNLLLGTLQEDAQLLVDYTTMFMTKPAFGKLEQEFQEEFKEAMYSVTVSLGRHTLSVLEIDPWSLSRHLPELFSRLELLSSLNKKVGIQSMAGAFENLRKGLVSCGLTYLNIETSSPA